MSGLPFAIPEIADELERGVVGFRSRIGEQNVLVSRRQKRRELGRQLDRPRVRGLEEVVVVGKRLQRLIARFGQFLVAVADLHAPQAGHAVDDLLAFGVPQIDALARG